MFIPYSTHWSVGKRKKPLQIWSRISCVLNQSSKSRKCQQPSPSRLLDCMNPHLNETHRADPSGSFIVAAGSHNAAQVKSGNFVNFVISTALLSVVSSVILNE